MIKTPRPMKKFRLFLGVVGVRLDWTTMITFSKGPFFFYTSNPQGTDLKNLSALYMSPNF